MVDPRQHTIDRIVEYVRGATILAPHQEIPLDQSLMDAGLFDSFGIVEMLTFLESAFNVTIPERDVTREKLGSVHKMADYVLCHAQNS